MKPIIRVENLGKQYRLGGPQEPYLTLRESLADVARAPWRRWRARGADAPQVWALRDVDFEVAAGEVVGVIGRNGAGKSTLLKVLSRITEPTRGRVELYGRVGSLLEVGTGFHPELTGRENIYLNGAILGMRRQEIARVFDDIVAFAEVEQFIDTPVKRYSSGMYLRLAFAVAAHLEPEILLVDEVLAVGDAQFQKKCLGKIGEVAQGGRTVLFVSHNMAAVQSLCGKALLLTRGQVAQFGAVKEVVSGYMREADTGDAPELFARAKRSGSGEVRFLDVKITPQENPAQPPSSGAALNIAMTLENTTAEAIAGVDVGFSLHDRYEIGLGLLYSSYMGRHFTLTPGRNEIRFVLGSPLLLGGSYYWGFRATRYGVELDWPQVLLPLEVVEDDYYGSGATNWRNWNGSLLLDGNWEQADIG
jgi:lipopolysaccharide transport system ATP-binding protein